MTTKQPQKAVDWVERAKAFYASTGKEIALAEFTNPRGQFIQNAQYIFVLDLNGLMLAHGMNRLFVGRISLKSRTLKARSSSGRSSI